MHHGTADLEILREVIFPVQAQHCLSLHAVFGVRLIRGSDVGSCVEDTLVDDGNLTGRVVDGIVCSLLKRNTSCGDLHRTLRNVICVERYHIRLGSLKLTHKRVLILLRYLFGYCLRGVIEFIKHEFISLIFCESAVSQLMAQIITEGLC